MDHIAYITGQFRHLTGHELRYSFNRFHQWQAPGWTHVTRGEYAGLTFDALKANVDRMVNSFRSKT